MAWVYKILLGVLLGAFGACQPAEDPPEPVGAYAKGVLVVNEGVFGNTSGTLTHYDRTHGATTPNLFRTANQRDLGDVVQSVAMHNDKAYIVVNNSNKIEVAEAGTFSEWAQITDLRLPRYFLAVSKTEAYVTEWGSDGLTGTVARLDLEQNTVVERISVEMGPERMVLSNGQLFITHPGGFGVNNKVSVLDVATRQVVQTIEVDDRPSSMVVDGQGLVWVACGGKVAYTTYPNIDVDASTESALVQIDPMTYQVVHRKGFGKGNPVGNLVTNRTAPQDLYYTNDGQVWRYHPTTGAETALFAGSYYGLGYDPVDQQLHAARSSGTNPATVEIRSPDGTLQNTYTAGVFANGFVFLP